MHFCFKVILFICSFCLFGVLLLFFWNNSLPFYQKEKETNTPLNPVEIPKTIKNEIIMEWVKRFFKSWISNIAKEQIITLQEKQIIIKIIRHGDFNYLNEIIFDSERTVNNQFLNSSCCKRNWEKINCKNEFDIAFHYYDSTGAFDAGNRWNEVLSRDIFIMRTKPWKYVSDLLGRDGKNSISLQNLNSFGSDVLGATISHFDRSGKIIENDIYFDVANHCWNLLESQTYPSCYYMFSAAAHELGHAIGYGHSPCVGDIMYPYLQAGMLKKIENFFNCALFQINCKSTSSFQNSNQQSMASKIFSWLFLH